MSIENIFSKLCILIILTANFSSSIVLTPIPVTFHKTYSFNLNEYSKFIIYSFKNDMDPNYKLIFRFSSIPYYSSQLYLYYSENDISENIGTLISCNPYTGEFFGSFCSVNIENSIYRNHELVLDSYKCESQYLMTGYIYAVISIVSVKENSRFVSDLVIYNTKYIPEIFPSKLYEYFEIGGPYGNFINFYIPKISNDTVLRLQFFSLVNLKVELYIYQNNETENILLINKVFNRSLIDDYIKLSKGYSYSIKFQEGIY